MRKITLVQQYYVFRHFMSVYSISMVLDSVIKRLMLTAINYSIAEARTHSRLNGMIDLRRSLRIRASDDFRAGMICGEAFARSAIMIRMYMGREYTKEESEALVQLLVERASEISESQFKSD